MLSESGTIAAAFNPLTNTVVAVNSFTNTVSVIDPTAPRRLNDGNLFPLNTQCPGKNCAVAVAIDPGTNQAVVVNQSDNSVSVLNLGAIQPFSITDIEPQNGHHHFVARQRPEPVASTGDRHRQGTHLLERHDRV